MSSLLQTKLKVKELMENNASDKTIDSFIEDQGFTIEQIKNLKIDQSKGVSLAERFKLGLAPNYASKEATIKKMYPDSAKMGSNFAIEKDGTAQVINPKGFDIGDIAEFGGRAITSIPINITGAYLGAKYSPTPVGKVVGGMIGAGTGEATGGEVADMIFQSQGGVIDRTPKERAFQRAFDFGVGSVSEIAGPFILKGIKAPFKGFTKNQSNKTANNLKIFEESNVQPRSMGMVSEAKITGNLLNDMTYILGNIPVAKESIADAGTKMQKEMGESLINTTNYLVSKPANVNTLKLGNIVKDGIENGVTQFKTTSGKLYDESFKRINNVAGEEFLTNPTQFVSLLDELATPSGANITKVVTKKMAKEDPSLKVGETIVVGKKPSVLQTQGLDKLRTEIKDKIADGRLTFAELRNYRTMIGGKLTNATLIDDVSKAEYKRLYGAISEDLKTILKNTDQKAYNQLIRADRYYKAGLKRIEDVLQPIKNVDQDRIVKYLMTSAGNGPTYISGLKKTLNPDEFAYIQNAIIQKLGKLKSGSGVNLDDNVYSDVFNSNIFLNNWNKIDPQAKDVLFSSKKYKDLRKDLDRLAVISEKIAQSGQTFSNPSGTANSLIGQLSYAGAVVEGKVSGLSKVFMTGLYLVGGSEVLTNPKIVKWLLKGTDIANTEGVDAYVKHLGKVGTVFAGTSPETQQWVLDFADTLTGQKDQKKEQ